MGRQKISIISVVFLGLLLVGLGFGVPGLKRIKSFAKPSTYGSGGCNGAQIQLHLVPGAPRGANPGLLECGDTDGEPGISTAEMDAFVNYCASECGSIIGQDSNHYPTGSDGRQLGNMCSCP